MFFAIFMGIKLMLKLCWLCIALTIWLVAALILIPTAIAQSRRGDKVASRRTMRSLNFGHRFWDPI